MRDFVCALTAIFPAASPTETGGTIEGGSVGVFSAMTSNISGGIINSGVITSALYGILVNNHSDISGGITNESGGTISAISLLGFIPNFTVTSPAA